MFNKNTINISYSCIRNKIASFNKVTCVPEQKNGCNFRNKESCPVQNKCLTPKVVYEAAMTNNAGDEKWMYCGTLDATFKEQFHTTTQSFNH